MLFSLTPMLEIHDLPATLRFYTEILSFNVDAFEYGMKECNL